MTNRWQRWTRFTLLAVILTPTLALLQGCGQMGPLYLPEESVELNRQP